MWRTAGLEEPNAKGRQTGPGEQADEVAAEGEVDNMEAGGFFARFGREHEGLRPTVIPRFVPRQPGSVLNTLNG